MSVAFDTPKKFKPRMTAIAEEKASEMAPLNRHGSVDFRQEQPCFA
jgi:hypothetical protein